MQLRHLLSGYDTYERHRLVATLLAEARSPILDVGGTPGWLASLVRAPVIVTNIHEGDVLSSGLHLPFPSEAFDTVTSLDVLEHIPPLGRAQFLSELMRVARRKIVLCAPHGSPEHEEQERAVLDRLARNGQHNEMLAQHVAYGLPRLAAALACVPDGYRVETYFTGDFRVSALLFQVDYLGGHRSFRLVKAAVSVGLTALGNALLYPLLKSAAPRAFANRMTLVITKQAQTAGATPACAPSVA